MSEQEKEQHGEARPDTGGDMLPAGALLAGKQYRIEKFLNSGGFGVTYLARNSLDRIVVIKECFPSFLCHRKNGRVEVRSMDHLGEYLALVNLFRAEAKALARLEHPNIVGVHEVFDDNNTAYMALDFVEGKDLLEIVETEPERLGPVLLRDLLTKVLGAVSYIHEQGVLHRDISPDNILIDRHNNPVLIDFGSARDSGRKSKQSTRLQSVKDGYSPHEFYARDMKHSASSDLYALGATFYYAITGAPPPASQYRLAQIIERKVDPYVPLKRKHDRYDPRLLETIDQSLSVVATRRIQSARNWLLAIDDKSRKNAALEKARRDSRMEELVRELVLETNRALECQAAEEAEQEKNAKERRKEEQAETRRKRDRQRQAVSEVLGEIDAFEIPVEQNKAEAAQAYQGFDATDQDPELNSDSRNIRTDAASVPKVVRSPKGMADLTQGDEPEQRRTQRAGGRRGFSINWNLPPLYVSNTVQLAGDFDR